MVQQYSSALLEKAVGEFSKLPGIGRKTALRLVLFMLRREEGDVDQFVDAIARMKREVKYCRVCHNISDTEVCPICSDSRRDASVICVVENVQDVLAVENTQQFHGLYHVLGGIISPMDGIGPADLEIDSLVQRVAAGGVKEVILALSSTMEGDTTNFYISRKLADYPVKLSVIARGISVGDELEYTEIQSILLDIISGLSSGRKVILHAILTRMSIFYMTQEHPVIFYKITCLCLNTEVQVLTAIITEIETRERRAAILLSTFKLSIGSQTYQKSCCCQNYFFHT
jgi:recombination protein RecR